MEDNVDKEVKEKFSIICKKCGREPKITFYAGFVHSQGGDTGSMTIICECGECIEMS